MRNLVARLGPDTGPAVVVVAHHDSVASSPGAADGGVGVAATLRLARRYGADPPERPLALVLADGEELGCSGRGRWCATA